MPSHQERIRAKNPEMNCHHLLFICNNTDIAPFIEENGDRTTVESCIGCGLIRKYTRTQKEFENELYNKFMNFPPLSSIDE